MRRDVSNAECGNRVKTRSDVGNVQHLSTVTKRSGRRKVRGYSVAAGIIRGPASSTAEPVGGQCFRFT